MLLDLAVEARQERYGLDHPGTFRIICHLSYVLYAFRGLWRGSEALQRTSTLPRTEGRPEATTFKTDQKQ